MKKVSKKLIGWADALVALSVFFIVLGIIGWFMESAWSFDVFHAGLLFMFLSPLTRGFSVLVQNAEEELDQRWMVKIKNAENEDEQ